MYWQEKVNWEKKNLLVFWKWVSVWEPIAFNTQDWLWGSKLKMRQEKLHIKYI